MGNRRVFLLAGNGSYSNRGCEAIVRGTTALLREQAGPCSFISNYFTETESTDEQRETDPHIIHRPFPFLKRYTWPWVKEQIARRIFGQPPRIASVSRMFLRLLPASDAVLMLGGDNYSPDYNAADVHFKLSRLAMEHKVPVAIWGASVGPFAHDPAYERWAAQELRRISLICVRETETQEYLASIGVEENVILSADPAFHLQPAACDLPANVEEALQGECIGLNLSPLLGRFIQFSSAEGNRLSAWAEVATEIVRCILDRFSQPLLLIPHVTSDMGDVGRDDSLFLHRVARQSREPERILVTPPDLGAAQTKWMIGRLSVFAGARTHSTLAAISSGVPTICIGYSMKARGIAKDVYGHLEWLIEGKDLAKHPSILCDRLVSLFNQESNIRSRLRCVNPEFRQRASKAAERFVGMIG